MIGPTNMVQMDVTSDLPSYSLEGISNPGADSDGPALIKYWGAHLPLFSVISTADR
jgi:hypothetical protein